MPISELFAQWEFFREAVYAGMIAGAVLGGLGVYLVARRMVFFAAALTQVSGLGFVLSLLVWGALAQRFAPEAAHQHGGDLLRVLIVTGGAFGLSALAAVGLGRGGPERSDQRLGLAWVSATALILLLGKWVDRNEIPNITLWMFGGRGDAGLLPEGDFGRLVAVLAAVAVVHVWWFRGFIASTLDPVGASVRGLPVGLLGVVLLLTLAAATSVGGAVLGMLPVFAFSLLPAMTAIPLAANLPIAVGIAAFIGALAAFVGYVAAFRFGQPVGASQAAVAALIAMVTQLGAGATARLRASRGM